MGRYPEGWTEKPIKFADSFSLDSLAESTPANYHFRYVDIGSVSNECGIESYTEMDFGGCPSRARKRVHVGDTIVSTVRTYLKAIALIEDSNDVIVSTGFSVIRPIEHDPAYLRYLCASEYFCQQVNKLAWGIAYPAISESLMGKIKVPVPPKEEQQAIAALLDQKCAAIDTTTNTLETQISTLERYRSSVIHEAVTRGLNPTAPTKPSNVDWIGDIPQGWETNKLKNVCTRIFDGPFGSNLTGSDYSDEGVRVVRLENIRFMSFDESKESYVTENKYRSISAHTVYPSDLIMATFVEDQVKVCELPSSIPFAVNKSDCVGIRLTSLVNKRYVHYWLSSATVAAYLQSQLHGATRGRVNTEQIRGIPLLLPPLDAQARIVDYLDKKCDACSAIITTKRKQLDVLKRRRQSLIYEYVTGKRRVGEEG